ncbi:MAG: YbaB/EbfC family nucleoid-associated protein [Nitrospirae bacterium]|nr:YbaB/EbfC family nucleoid-associated protein [Nitrospirota bacterium]MCL5286100.1 YbaB/EbfC family nucleoid-associated protein [Nitrospirota bacterium]
MFGQDFLKKAQEMQEKIARMQQDIARMTVTGSAGGRLVTVEMNGNNEVLSVRIAPELLKNEEVSMIEDLVVAATNDAVQKVRLAASKVMEEMTGIPGDMPMGNLGIPGL